MHQPLEALRESLRALPPPPADEGRVALVVARPEVNARETPARCRLTPSEGVSGDRWARKERPNPDSQITVMRVDVARALARGEPLSLFGDNLFLELDLSEQNLPAGTRLRVGTALCEVTPLPHTGCGKFAARFGDDARAITAHDEFRGWRLRGIHLRVIEEGEAGPGDPVRVLSRPPAVAPAEEPQ